MLKLTDEQVPQVEGALHKFATDMEAAAALAEVEEPDNQAIIGAVKKARNDFKSGMKGILDKEQFETLETTLDAVFQEMFEDIAEIRLIDLEPVLDLTPEQVEALKPVMGTGMRQIIAVVFEYGDKRLTMPRKVKMGKKVKRIQADMDAGVAEILSEEQLAKGLDSRFELLSMEENGMGQRATIRIKSEKEGSGDLIRNLLEITEIKAFNEILPGMNDIFIQVVNDTNVKKGA